MYRNAILILLLASVLPAGQVFAAEAVARSERVPAMREPIYRQLGAAREAADKGNHAAALKVLERLRDTESLNSYEAAMVRNLLAYVYYSQDRPQQALAAYEQVLQQGAIPESLRNSTLYSLAQMYLVNEQYRKAQQMLDRWLVNVQEPSPEALVLKGQIHYQLGEYRKARVPLERAISLAEEQNRQVQETWLLLLRAVYYQDKDYPALLGVLEKLVTHYPQREYWLQLGAVYGELGQEKKQLAVLETAHEQGLLNRESDLVTLAQLLIANGVPYKAGRILQQGLDDGVVEKTAQNLRLLADAWLLARDYRRGVTALEQAAGIAPDGELYLRLAQSRLELREYAAAADAAGAALEKGGLDEPARAHVVAGIALYNLQHYDGAIAAFEKARRSAQLEQVADQWLRYVRQERQRRTRLDQVAASPAQPARSTG